MDEMISRYFLAVCPILYAIATSASMAAESVDYQRDVYPVFQKYCIGCHSADESQGGLVMDDFARLMVGGDSGVAVTAGVPASSRLLLMVTGKLEPAMPPDDAEGPSEAEIEILANWIEKGAIGPEGDMPIKRTIRTPDIQPKPSVPAPITAIAISKDGKTIARATFGRIQISGDNSELVSIEDADLGKINSLRFSGSAKQLLVASGLTGAYGRAAIYETASGNLIREFIGHRDTIYAATFSPDESVIATAGYDRKIILWDAASGDLIRELVGHNGAIFDLAFSPDGKVLVSACADETAKVWNVEQGIRLDTLSQPEGEVLAVAVTRDGKFIVAGSADNRLRVWQLQSTEKPKINPLVATRFIDETPIVNFAISPDGQSLVAIAESGQIKLVRTADWQPIASLESLGESGTDLFFSHDGTTVNVSLMNGELVSRPIPLTRAGGIDRSDADVHPVLMDLGVAQTLDETELRSAINQSGAVATVDTDWRATVLDTPRHVSISGQITEPSQADLYRWRAGKGELWAIDADAITVDGSPGGRLDPIVTVLDANGVPIIRVRLQAIRDSYFTFRGKDSSQTGDFRVFNWQEMKLSEYLYAAGEVTRLHMHPRGPDSGFDVYPGEGNRWTYFGTSGTTHALGEPAYIVRPLPPGSEPLANGLPTFDVVFENDDDPYRMAGKNSRLLFTAPDDGLYTVRISDTRGEGGDDYRYRLTIRPATPGFVARTQTIGKPLHPATGREFKVSIDRIDGYDGPVTFEIDGLPDRLISNSPITIEAGQQYATGMVWASADEKGWEGEIEPTLTAWAMVDGKRVERSVGSIGKLKFDSSQPQVAAMIKPANSEVGDNEGWTLRVRRGETVSARVLINRKEGFQNEVSFGKERSGKNASQGVYVDNIGLNGLLIVAGATEREFFVTADETAIPGKRSFFLTAEIDGGLATHPIIVEVLP
ncbi:MAG: hypothetical protein KDB00_03015 [Planctomycetales bacterium]|nr:hypothetical protein [Planctomycetales bacterium]